MLVGISENLDYISKPVLSREIGVGQMDLIFTELLNLRTLIGTEIQKIKILKDDLLHGKNHKIVKFFEDNTTKNVVGEIKNTLKELNI